MKLRSNLFCVIIIRNILISALWWLTIYEKFKYGYSFYAQNSGKSILLLAYRKQTSFSAFIKHATFYTLLVFTALMVSDNALRISIFHHNFAVVSFIGSGLFILWLLKIYAYGYRSLAPFMPAALMLLWFSLSTIWSIAPSATLTALAVFLSVTFYAIIFYDMIESERDLRLCWQLFIFSLLVCSIKMIFLAAHHIYWGDSRSTSFDYNPNDMAYLLVISLPITGYLIECGKNKFITYINYLYIFLAPIAIILTASRTAFLCLIVVAIYFFYKYRTFFLSPLNITLLLFLIIIGVSFLQEYAPTISFHLYHTDSVSPSSSLTAPTAPLVQPDLSNGRVNVWLTGLTISQSHLIEGTGFATFANLMSIKENLYIAAHNIFIQVFVETGVVGLLLFLMWYIRLALMTLRNSHAIMLSSMFVVFTIVASLNNIFLMKQTWFFFATILVMNNLDKKTVSMKIESNPIDIL